MTDSALILKDIKKGFFGVEVLHGITVSFEKGEVCGMVGENGAGKSTLMNVIGGVFKPESGEMTVDGLPYNPTNPKDASKARIAFIHQELNLFSNLSIAENLYIDNLPKTKFGAIDYKGMKKMTSEQLKKFSIEENPSTIVANLPMGVRQTIEIAKALIADAKVILFDEPTTSLSNKEKEQLFKTIGMLKEQGVAVVFISHIIEDVFTLCDKISILRDGSLIKTCDADKITKDELISLMVGRKLEKVYPTVEKEIGGVQLKINNLVAEPVVKGISLELHHGEILGIFGLMGSGRTEFVRALYGADPITSGSIELDGKTYYKTSPIDSINRGMAFITEDRRSEGLLMPKPVEDNIVLVNLNNICNKIGVMNKKLEDDQSNQIIRELSVKVNDKKMQTAANLSGGNQQKLVIGKWLLGSPEVLIMDEPTRGVDVGAKYEIYSLIQTLAKNGSGVLFISSEMEELIGVCDRILVVRNGVITGGLHKGEFDQKKIMYYALEEDVSNA